MLEAKLVSPYSVTPTHHLIYDKFKAVQDSAQQDTLSRKPVVLLGEPRYIYDGHHRIMDARMKKSDVSAYVIHSQENFLQLPKELWNPELSPETHSFDEVLHILERASLADDEVFN